MNKKKLINDLKLIVRFDKTFINVELAYKSEIQQNGELVTIGYYNTQHEANTAYNKKAKQLYGMYHQLQII